jgi:hypothetical protein
MDLDVESLRRQLRAAPTDQDARTLLAQLGLTTNQLRGLAQRLQVYPGLLDDPRHQLIDRIAVQVRLN